MGGGICERPTRARGAWVGAEGRASGLDGLGLPPAKLQDKPRAPASTKVEMGGSPARRPCRGRSISGQRTSAGHRRPVQASYAVSGAVRPTPSSGARRAPALNTGHAGGVVRQRTAPRCCAPPCLELFTVFKLTAGSTSRPRCRRGPRWGGTAVACVARRARSGAERPCQWPVRAALPAGARRRRQWPWAGVRAVGASSSVKDLVNWRRVVRELACNRSVRRCGRRPTQRRSS
jgi:hypothetical protein